MPKSKTERLIPEPIKPTYLLVTKMESISCILLLRVQEEDNEEIQEAAMTPAAAKEIIVDSRVAAQNSMAFLH